MSNFLRRTCIECANEAGVNDIELIDKVYSFMHKEYESKGKSWNCAIIDNLIKEYSNNQFVEFRNLDSTYFRVKRNKRYVSVCFSDLTEEEMDEVMKNKDTIWLKNMCKIMAKTLRDIGDQLDIIGEDEEEESDD